jgi:hypothetical protein
MGLEKLTYFSGYCDHVVATVMIEKAVHLFY